MAMENVTAADLAAGLRALDADPAEGSPEAKQAPVEKAPEPDKQDLNTEGAETETEVDPAAEVPAAEVEEAEEDPGSEEPAGSEQPADPEVTKRLEAIARQEKKSKEAIQAQLKAAKAELAEERQRLEAEWRPKVEAARRFEQLAEQVRIDPVGVLTALGLTSEDLLPAARLLYASSTAGAADPRLRAQAAEAMRQRRIEEESAQTRRQLDELRRERDMERQQAEHARQVDVYLDKATEAISAEHAPLVARIFEKNPGRCRARLVEVAEDLIERTGDVPDVAEVVAELERIEREDLAERGIDPTAALSPKKLPALEGSKKAGAFKTLTTQTASTKTPPRSTPMTEAEELADIARALKSGTLD